MELDSSIFVAGRDGLIRNAVLRALEREGFRNVIDGSQVARHLTDRSKMAGFFRKTAPDYVFVTGGKSGGIGFNRKHPADLILDNLLLECSVIDAAWRSGVKKLLYLASSCCYPRDCEQPMRESMLMSGRLEPTNEAYATAKLAGIKLCEAYRSQHGANFICGVPANAFGPGDDFDPENSHVIAALLDKTHHAKINGLETVGIWGSGTPRREFIFADDLADACLVVMRKYEGTEPINLGVGEGRSIMDLAKTIAGVVGFEGTITCDVSKPDGMPVKILDCGKLAALGWRPPTDFRQALEQTYAWRSKSLSDRIENL